MPRESSHDPDDGDDERIDEGPDDHDLDPDESEDDAPTDECPACGREIHADTDWCPYCGRAIEREARSLPTWFWIAALLALLSAGLWLVR